MLGSPSSARIDSGVASTRKEQRRRCVSPPGAQPTATRMGWSFRIARIAGIDIRVHLTFALILALGAYGGWLSDGFTGALFGVLLMILLFTCVTLHELGHSIAAQRFGIPVREIVLLPLGGVAFLARNPTNPWHELIIAIAGPLVNVVIAIVLALATGTAYALGVVDLAALQLQGGAFPRPSLEGLILWLLQANVSLVLFNLIPAFPLDGGRVLRAVLALLIGMPRATRVAALIGQVFAVGFGVIGVLTGNLVLALVAIFIFLGAGQENAEGQVRTMLTTHRVGDLFEGSLSVHESQQLGVCGRQNQRISRLENGVSLESTAVTEIGHVLTRGFTRKIDPITRRWSLRPAGQEEMTAVAEVDPLHDVPLLFFAARGHGIHERGRGRRWRVVRSLEKQILEYESALRDEFATFGDREIAIAPVQKCIDDAGIESEVGCDFGVGPQRVIGGQCSHRIFDDLQRRLVLRETELSEHFLHHVHAESTELCIKHDGRDAVVFEALGQRIHADLRRRHVMQDARGDDEVEVALERRKLFDGKQLEFEIRELVFLFEKTLVLQRLRTDIHGQDPRTRVIEGDDGSLIGATARDEDIEVATVLVRPEKARGMTRVKPLPVVL